ncbi:MAG TPA: hypothetical protein VNJ01_12270 [Bacteriovoracaceae bacterium]|nr:hypothetical protein [Bacteriovoracaceae bacterium]
MENSSFKDLLDLSYQWPDYYEFKFIVKSEDLNHCLALLPDCTVHETPSKNGNFVSISARKLINSTQEVIEIYQLMGSIKGIISL